MTSPIYSHEAVRLIASVAQGSLRHAILLDGPEGVGLFTLAGSLAGKTVAGIIQPTNVKGEIDQQKGSIKIAQIRTLYEATKGKTTHAQVFIIDDADTMGLSAQNALLKLLEEPAENIHFILTAHHAHKLLPTIISRVQRTYIAPVSTLESERLISAMGVTEVRKVQQLLYVADGLPAELSRLINDERLFAKRVELVTDARHFLQGTPLEKATVASKYHGDRDAALQMIACAETILSRALASQPTTELVTRADTLATIYDRIAGNGNIRLQLLSVVV